MSKIAVVTDSTATIPHELVKQYQITVAPQVLIWGGETYADGVDIQPSEFYTRLSTAKVMPSTSQVTPAVFQRIFTDLTGQGYQVMAILISNLLSGTIASALQARENLPQGTVIILDSQATAMALGFQVLAVARAAADGASLSECKEIADRARERTGVIFAVDTLEFLHRGGRIGGASRFLGTALNIKPILELQHGRVEALERVRTRKKSLDRLIELVEERAKGRRPLRLAALHANALESAKALLEDASQRLSPQETLITDVSPVLGANVGPGTVGIAYMAGM